MLGLRRLHVVKRNLRCVAKSGKGLCQIAHLSVVSKNTGENSLSQNEHFVSLTHLKTCDVSILLNRFGLSLNSTCTISGENLTLVDSKVELEEFVGSDIPSVKFKAFLTCLNAFKIIGVPVCLLDDSSKQENTHVARYTASLPAILKEDSQSHSTTTVSASTTQPKNSPDYNKFQVLKGPNRSRVYSASLLSGNNKMITLSGELHVWNLETNECEQEWNNKEFGQVFFCVLSDGRVVASDCDYAIKIYDHKSKLCVQTLKGHTKRVKSFLVLEDNTVVSTSDDFTIRHWDLNTGKCLKKFNVDVIPYELCAVSDDTLAIRSNDKTIRILNVKTGKYANVLIGHTVGVRCFCKLPDGRLASGGADDTIRIWNVETGVCENVLTLHTDTVSEVKLLPDGRLISSSHDRTICECEQVIQTVSDQNILLILNDGRILCDGERYDMLYIRG